ncbi:hypothetical protein NXF42_23890, partial [Klebsiella pneumoniae]|nr:hypothetical protein [Klebsiella pneumoniae]
MSKVFFVWDLFIKIMLLLPIPLITVFPNIIPFLTYRQNGDKNGTVAKLAMRQPFVLFKGLTFQKLCLP